MVELIIDSSKRVSVQCHEVICFYTSSLYLSVCKICLRSHILNSKLLLLYILNKYHINYVFILNKCIMLIMYLLNINTLYSNTLCSATSFIDQDVAFVL